MAYDLYTFNRLFQTSLGNFDQIVSLGEEYINTSFAMMYKLSDLDSPIRHITVSPRGLGTLDADLLAPQVQLIVDGTDFSSLKYYMKLKSGTLQTYVSEDSNDDTMATYDVTGWVFVFRIAIGNQVVPTGSPEYNTLKTQVSYEGEFTLAKLFLDSTKANMADTSLQAESSYGKYNWSAQPAGVQANWKDFVSRWINNVDGAGKTLLGLTVTPTYIPENATFPPTYLSKQTYPYYDPSVKPQPPAQNGNPQNQLLYLMMADNHTPPSPVLLQPNSGMWIDTFSNIKGTFAMSSDLFWNQWLLPLLTDFNKKTQFYTTTPYVHVADDQASVTFNFDIGQNPAPASYFAFQPGINPNDGSQVATSVAQSIAENNHTSGPGIIAYHWAPSDFDVNDADQQGSNPPHGTFRAVAEQRGHNQSQILFNPGSQEIVLSGSGTASARIDYEGTDTPAWATYEEITFNLSWSLTLQIASIDTTGSVQVQIKDYVPGQKIYTLTYNDDTSTLKGTLIQDLTPGYAQQVMTQIDQTFQYVMSGLEDSLASKLANQNRLYLPASGAFFFKNATFNKNGDFLAQVLYNGTDAPDTGSVSTTSHGLGSSVSPAAPTSAAAIAASQALVANAETLLVQAQAAAKKNPMAFAAVASAEVQLTQAKANSQAVEASIKAGKGTGPGGVVKLKMPPPLEPLRVGAKLPLESTRPATAA